MFFSYKYTVPEKRRRKNKWRQQPCSWKPASWPITCGLKHQACLLAHRSLSSWSTHGPCHLAHQNLWPGLTVKGIPFQGQSAKTRIGDYFFKCASINKRIQRSIRIREAWFHQKSKLHKAPKKCYWTAWKNKQTKNEQSS